MGHSGVLAIEELADVTAAPPDWLARVERVHRQLRPAMAHPYADVLRRIRAGGARVLVASHAGMPAGVAVWRVIENTAAGRRLYVDDLVTDELVRSTGVGHELLAYIEREARTLGCDTLELDSGTQRTQAHKFYFREGLVVTAFAFRKPLK